MFCQKFGAQLSDSTAVCHACGAQPGNGTAPVVAVKNQALSLQDFLTLSFEYAAKKSEMRRKITKSMAIHMSTGGLLLFASFSILFLLMSMPLFFLSFLSGVALLFVGAFSEARYTRKLEKYGEELFRDYMKDK